MTSPQAQLDLAVPEVLPPPGKSDEFYTPDALYQALNRELKFTLDVCATVESARCKRFFTVEQNGLAQRWDGESIWCNPPYSDIEPWAAKLAELFERGRARNACLLPPANRTEQPWWQTFVEPYRDLRPNRIREPHIIHLVSNRTVVLPVVVPCRRRKFTLEARFIGKRIPFGFPGDLEGITSEGGKFATVALIWECR